jgi:putative OPT family oligopeptide transporter
MSDSNFKPYIPAEKIMPEFTIVSVCLGALLSIIFGGANAYLGLRVGMTVSASIPAAVISMGIYRKLLNRDSILENNMVQTVGSAGESLAAGSVFTMPAIFMWANEGLCAAPTLLEAGLVALCGGLLGVLFMIPLRNALIVKEHGTLRYPEGVACAEVLIAGEEGGSKFITVFSGLGLAAIYKFIADGLKLFPSEVDWTIPGYKGAGIGVDILPALAGVGFICGPRVTSYLFSGGITAWLCIMPLIVLFGSDAVIYPATVPVTQLWSTGGTWAIWSKFIRYIGAGTVAMGGILSLLKSLPLIIRTFKEAVGGFGEKGLGSKRTEQDIPMHIILVSILAIIVFIWLVPTIPVNFVSAVIIAIFGFFFATVASRIVGLIGSSNSPVSGMAIATLLVATFILKATGNTGIAGMLAAITIGSVISVDAAIAADISQDLKTGFLLGATPKKQQWGELIGVLAASLAIGSILILLNTAWGFGSTELAAPQATLMKMVIEGIMGGNLPWGLVMVGVFLGLVVEILGIPVLPFAIGLYLPIHLSMAIMTGGVLRYFIEHRSFPTEKIKEKCIQSGVLYTSGLIAGEGIVGILLAVLAVTPFRGSNIGAFINISKAFSIGKIGGIICFLALLATILKATIWDKDLEA